MLPLVRRLSCVKMNRLVEDQQLGRVPAGL